MVGVGMRDESEVSRPVRIEPECLIAEKGVSTIDADLKRIMAGFAIWHVSNVTIRRSLQGGNSDWPRDENS